MPTREEFDARLAAFSQPSKPIPSAADLRTAQTENPGFFRETLNGIFGGIEDGVQSIYELADTLTFGILPNPWEDVVPDTQTAWGGIVGGISQFAVGFGAVGAPLVSVATRALGKVNSLKWAVAAPTKVAQLAAAGKTTQAMILNAATSGVAAGAIADFTAFQEDEQRLSNLIQATGLANPITEFLAADDDDGVLLGRLKNTIEGGLVGIPFQFGLDSIIRALGRGKFARKAIEAGVEPGEAIQQAVAKFPVDPPVTTAEVVETGGKIHIVPKAPVVDPAAPVKVEPVKVEAPDPTEEITLASGAKVARKDLDKLQAKVAKELTSRIAREDLAVGRQFENKPGEILEAVEESLADPRSLNINPREVSQNTLDELRIAKSFPNRSGDPFHVADPRSTEIIKAAEARGFNSKGQIEPNSPRARKQGIEDAGRAMGATQREIDRAVAADIELRRRNMDIFTGTPDASAKMLRAGVSLGFNATGQANPTAAAARAKTLDEVGQMMGANPKEIERAIASARLGPQQIYAITNTGILMKSLAEMQGIEWKEALTRIKEKGEFTTEVVRELEVRGRSVMTMLEAGNDIFSSLGFNLPRSNKLAFPNEFKGGVQEAGGKTAMEWGTLRELSYLATAGVTPETVGRVKVLIDEMDAIFGSPDILEAVTSLKNYMESSRPQKFGSQLMEYFINSVLSTPASWVVNGLGAVNMGIFLPVERMLGAKVLGVTGRASDQIVKDVIARETKVIMNFVRGFGEAWNIAKNNGGKAYRKLTKFETAGEFSPIKQGLKDAFGDNSAAKLAGQILTFPSAVMNRTDDFFKILSYRARAGAELYELAVKEGVPPAEISNYVEETLKIMTENRAVLRMKASIDNVLPGAIASGADDIEAEVLKRMDPQHEAIRKVMEIHDRAVSAGENITWTKALGAENGAISSLGAHATALVRAHPVLKIFLPFIRTPANIAQFSWDHTFGAALDASLKVTDRAAAWAGSPNVKATERKLFKQLTDPSPQIRADAAGRLAMATTFFGTASAVYYSGILADDFPLFTGTGPQDKEERRALEAAGWQPFSIRIGDKYFSYQRFDPFASLLGIIADWTDLSHRMALDPSAGWLDEVVTPMIAAVAQNITSKTYMEGLSNMLTMASGDTNGIKRAFGSTIGGFMPGILSGPTADIDPTMREIRSVFDRFLTRVPGLSTTLAPRRNMLGEVVKRSSTTGLGTADMFLPTRSLQISDDVIMQEVAAAKFGFNITPLRYRGVDLTDSVYTQNGQDAYDRLGELKGTVKVGGLTLRQSLRKLIQSPAFQALPTEPDENGNQSPRVYLMNGVLNKYQKAAWERLTKENKEVRNAADQVTAARRSARRPSLLN
jgi:hypothetical protein